MFKKKVHKSITKFDKIITWVIIWWALASIFWASKTSVWKKTIAQWKNIFQKVSTSSIQIFWKWVIKILNIFKSKK